MRATRMKTSGRTPRPSDRWLWAALVTTVVAVALGVYMMTLMGPVLDTGEPVLVDGAADVVGSDPLVVVVARTPGGSTEWGNFARVIGFLSEEIGQSVAVRYVAREDEAGAIVRAEEADVAFLCAHMYMELSDAGLVEGIVVPVIDGRSDCSMQLVVRAGDPAEDLADLEGRAVAVSDKSSLGGQAYLIWECGQNGVDLLSFFSEVRTGETMEENLAALLDGDVDATVVNTVQLSDADAERVKVISESPPFGLPPVTVASDMDTDLKAALIRALVDFDAAERLSAESSIDGFVSISEVDYSFENILRQQCGDHGHIK